jgi:hypothetical protein
VLHQELRNFSIADALKLSSCQRFLQIFAYCQ